MIRLSTKRVTAQGTDGAIAASLKAPGGMEWCRLVSVFLSLETAPGVANVLTITKDSGLGSDFDIELYTADLNGLDEARFYGEQNVLLQAKSASPDYDGDAVAVAFPNAGDGAWFLEAIFESR